jgi:hypothetical protein
MDGGASFNIEKSLTIVKRNHQGAAVEGSSTTWRVIAPHGTIKIEEDRRRRANRDFTTGHFLLAK